MRIGRTVRKVKALVEKTEIWKQKVYQLLPSIVEEVEEFVTCAQLAQHTKGKKRQQAKFQRILDKDARKDENNSSGDSIMASDIMSRCVRNCYDHLLSDPELSVLKKNFDVTPHRVPVVDIVTATKSACRSPGSGKAQVEMQGGLVDG